MLHVGAMFVAIMYVDSSTVTSNGKTYTRHLLRDSYREDGKVKHHTIANLSHCPTEEVEAIRLALRFKGDLPRMVAAAGEASLELVQGPSVGAAWLLWRLAQELGIVEALGTDRQGLLALWQVMARVIDQGSRLSAVRLAQNHAACAILGLEKFDENDLYGNLDWLADNQAQIETRLFRGRAPASTPDVFLYDVTSSYLEGTQNAFAAFGYNRDAKRGKRQIVIGLLCDGDGRPLSIEVFPGNTADVKTFASQLNKVAERFNARQVTFVGDRGMIKGPQREAVGEAGFHYITAITKEQIEGLIKAGVLQMDLFDEALAEVEGLDKERYILRRNPVRKAEIAEVRQDKLNKLKAAVADANAWLAEHTRATAKVQVERLLARIKKLRLAEIVTIATEGRSLALTVDDDALAEAARLDGCYVLRTDLAKTTASKELVHNRYKDLAQVESAFRDSKSIHLEMRPVYLRNENRTRGHAFVVMIAYILIQTLRQRWVGIDQTVQEGLDCLSSLTLTELRVGGRASCYQVPVPRDDLRQLFEAAAIPIPASILPSSVKVATRKKLPERRKL
jgi:hypothetical protein